MSFRLKVFFVFIAFVEVVVLMVANYDNSLRRVDRNVVAREESDNTDGFSFQLGGFGSNSNSTGSSPTTARPDPNDATGTTSRNTVVDEPGLVIPDDVEIWHRDNAYMSSQIGARTKRPPLALGNHVASPEDEERDAFKVLVVGDSFVWGWGFYDMDRVWHHVLETKLSERYGPGAYRIDAVAHHGTSIISYSENLSAATIKKYDPDLIVVGFLPNDWQPDGSEQRICRGKAGTKSESTCELGSWYTRPEYVKCLEGRSNLIGVALRRIVKPFFPKAANSLIERMCDPKSYPDDVFSPNEIRDMGKDPERSLYWPMYLDAIKTIKENAGSVPVVALPTTTNEYIVNPVVYEALQDGGITVVPTPKTKALLASDTDRSQKALWINPADPHPNAHLHYAYGTDMFNYIAERFPKQKVNSRYEMALLSNFTPSSMLFSTSSDGATARFGHDPTTGASARQTVNNDYRTVPTPPQAVACAPYGRPHARFVFNPQLLIDAFTATVTLDEAIDTAMVFSTVSYDSYGREQFSRPKPFKPGSSIDARFDEYTTGFVIGSASPGCPITKAISLPAFDLTITKRY